MGLPTGLVIGTHVPLFFFFFTCSLRMLLASLKTTPPSPTFFSLNVNRFTATFKWLGGIQNSYFSHIKRLKFYPVLFLVNHTQIRYKPNQQSKNYKEYKQGHNSPKQNLTYQKFFAWNWWLSMHAIMVCCPSIFLPYTLLVKKINTRVNLGPQNVQL